MRVRDTVMMAGEAVNGTRALLADGSTVRFGPKVGSNVEGPKIERGKIKQNIASIAIIVTLASGSFYLVTANMMRSSFWAFWFLRLICVGVLLSILRIYARLAKEIAFARLGFGRIVRTHNLKYALLGVGLSLLVYGVARLTIGVAYPPAEFTLQIERYPPLGYLIALLAYSGLLLVGLFDVGFCVAYLQTRLTDKLGVGITSSIAISSIFYGLFIVAPYVSSVFRYSALNLIGSVIFNIALMAFLGYFYYLTGNNLAGPIFAYAGLNLLFPSPLEGVEISPSVYYLVLTSNLLAGIIFLKFISPCMSMIDVRRGDTLPKRDRGYS